jgi:hypothetical protein
VISYIYRLKNKNTNGITYGFCDGNTLNLPMDLPMEEAGIFLFLARFICL